MDNVTHTLSAILVSRAGLNRLTPHAALLLVAGANAPDLDVLCGLAGPQAYLQFHRGASHSLVAMPVIALAVAVLIGLFRRRDFVWWRACLVALVGVASNPIFDLANSYGVKILWPFSSRWINGDFLAIVDLWILLLFSLALVAPWFSRLVSREIGAKAGSGRAAAVVVLLLAAGYAFGKYVLHERAVAVLDSRTYRGEIPLRVAAMPSPINPFAWTGLVEGRGFVEAYPMNLLAEFDPSSDRSFYKPSGDARVEAASRSAQFRGFLAFAQWPVWRVTPVAEPEGAARVELFDLRFDAGGHFSVSAVVDAQGRPVEPSRLGK